MSNISRIFIWLTDDHPHGGVGRSRIASMWLAFERAALVVGSLTAVFGVWSWYWESDGRRLERAAKIYDATSGAISTIEQSRGRVEEFGQSDALSLLNHLGRPLDSIDLNDTSINSITLHSPLVQPAGSIVFLNNFTFKPAVDVKIQFPNTNCTGNRLISVDWIMLNETELGKFPICILGSLIGIHVNARRIKMIQDPPTVKLKEVRSNRIRDVITPFAQKISKQSKSVSPDDYELPTLISIRDSEMQSSSLKSYAQIARFKSVSFLNSKIDLNADSINFVNANLRGAILKAPNISLISENAATRRDCASRDLLKDRALKRTDVKAQRPTTNALAERMDVDQNRMAITIEAMRCMYELDGPDVSSGLAFGFAPIGLRIADSDLRGADLSSVPADYLELESSCVDRTTKLPKGVKVLFCSAKAIAYWDAVERCGLVSSKTKASTRGCKDLSLQQLGRQQSEFESIYISSLRRSRAFGVMDDYTNPVDAFESAMGRYLVGRDHMPRPGRSNGPFIVVSAVSGLDGSAIAGEANYRGTGL